MNSTLMHMHMAGKDIAVVFAGTLDPAQVSKMTQRLLDLMNSSGQGLHEKRMMLLGALAALGQEIAIDIK